jgi:hypothetical protein
MAKLLVLAMAVAMACQSNQPAPTVAIDAARAELAALISDVTASTKHWYDVTDDLGREMGPTDIIWVPEADEFAAAYFTYSDTDGQFHVQIATSVDLETWTWRVELASQASQPSITAGPAGTYLLAWEQEPDPIYIVLEEFAGWNDVLTDRPTRHFDVPITTPACGEGTPSFESVSAERVQIGFHYHASCERDLQAEGSTDWSTWQSSQRRSIDHALIKLGVEGHIGDRDSITYRGHDFTIVEGQRVLDDVSTWRLFLYDAETETALPLDIRTHAGSVSMGNPSVSLVDIAGRPTILVSMFVITEGSRAGEDLGLIYYREL